MLAYLDGDLGKIKPQPNTRKYFASCMLPERQIMVVLIKQLNLVILLSMFVCVNRHTDRKSYKYMQCPNVCQCVSQSIPGVVYIGTEKKF